MTYEILCWAYLVVLVIVLILYVISLHYGINVKGWDQAFINELNKDFTDQNEINLKLNDELNKRNRKYGKKADK